MTAVTDSINHYRRRAFVHLIARSPYAAGDPLAPWQHHDSLWEVFEDRADLLGALQAHWMDLLTHAVFASPEYPIGSDGIRRIYADLATANPSLRAILAAFEADAAIARQVMDEHVLLARAAGNLDTRASASTLVWRARDLLDSVPEQRGAKHVAAS